MTKRYFAYFFWLYAKNFAMILLGVGLGVTVIDYLQNIKDFTGHPTQVVLYLFYTLEYSLSLYYPIVIVFATIVTYVTLVNRGTLVSLFSFGYSRKALFLPFFLSALLVYLVLVFLQMGSFAYAKEQASAVKQRSQSLRIVDNLFFKYNNSFVYIKKLDPIQKIIYDVTIFGLKNKKIHSSVVFKKADFDGEYWIANDAIVTLQHYQDGKPSGFEHQHIAKVKLLKDYKPKVIELIYEGESLSIIDAIHTLTLLKKQRLDTDKIRSALYFKLFFPLFAFVMMVIIFFKTPYHARSMNKELIWSLTLGGTLIAWGLLYSFFNLGKNGTFSPDITVTLPLILSIAGAIHLYRRGNT